MCFDWRARPPIQPIAGGAQSGRDLVLTAADGAKLSAYAVKATRPSGAGIVILPDIRGLHDYYVELADRFAEHDVDAVAIDYFGRTAGLGRRGEGFDWQTHIPQTRADQIMQDVRAAADYLRSDAGGAVRSLFTVGFCFGGGHSWLQTAAGHGLAGAIGFYGGPLRAMGGGPAPIDAVDQFACPILGLFGGADRNIPQDAIDRFETALTNSNVPHEIIVYPGAPHSFFGRHYEKYANESADAWQTVLTFIDQYRVHAGA